MPLPRASWFKLLLITVFSDFGQEGSEIEVSGLFISFFFFFFQETLQDMIFAYQEFTV